MGCKNSTKSKEKPKKVESNADNHSLFETKTFGDSMKTSIVTNKCNEGIKQNNIISTNDNKMDNDTPGETIGNTDITNGESIIIKSDTKYDYNGNILLHIHDALIGFQTKHKNDKLNIGDWIFEYNCDTFSYNNPVCGIVIKEYYKRKKIIGFGSGYTLKFYHSKGKYFSMITLDILLTNNAVLTVSNKLNFPVTLKCNEYYKWKRYNINRNDINPEYKNIVTKTNLIEFKCIHGENVLFYPNGTQSDVDIELVPDQRICNAFLNGITLQLHDNQF
mmetsp:Transcript_3474/g.4270  ORF Transcript_3474/g.4270 Transcript_3474/m.4270 type:complete len:276 (-) Transcript_3474:64-891(-)